MTATQCQDPRVALRAVERLRPSWMRSRSGDTPVLYVDGARRGNTNDLNAMMATDIPASFWAALTEELDA